jgi:hypothetical protein
MKRAGMGAARLAALAGTNRQQIHKLARGERQLTMIWAKRLAEPLGTTWHELLGAPATGLSDGFRALVAPGAHDEVRFASELAETSEAVAEMLREERMPTDQRTVTAVALEVWREADKLGRHIAFQERLGLAVSERRSVLRRKWEAVFSSR